MLANRPAMKAQWQRLRCLLLMEPAIVALLLPDMRRELQALTRNRIPRILISHEDAFAALKNGRDYRISVYIRAHPPYPVTQLSSSPVTRLLRDILGSTLKAFHHRWSQNSSGTRERSASCLPHTVGLFHVQLCKPGGISDAHFNEHPNQATPGRSNAVLVSTQKNSP